MDLLPRRLTVGRLMAVVAILAVVLGAELFRRANSDVEQAAITLNLRNLTAASAAARRDAAENLSRAETTEHGPILAALARVILSDPDAATRFEAVRSLRESLLHAFWLRIDPSPGSGSTVAAASAPAPIGGPDSEAEAIRVLILALGDGEARVRGVALEALIQVQDQATPAAGVDRGAGAPLTRLLGDPDPGIRAASTWAVARLTQPPAEARDRLLDLIRRDPDMTVRIAAVRALVQGWPGPDLYLPCLVQAGRASPKERAAIIGLLVGVDVPPPSESVPTLVRLLAEAGDESFGWPIPDLIASLPKVLARLGPAARPYLGVFRDQAARIESQVGQEANWFAIVAAMARIDPTAPEAQAMLELLDARRPPWGSTGPNSPLEPSPTLRLYDAAAAPLVPRWRALLRSPTDVVREDAAAWLGWIGSPALPALDDLEALQRDRPSPQVERSVLQLRSLQPH